MDKWIQLGVIEPSKSPWASPAFIIYQNGKPRMVVDYRKLNEIAIANKFPLPKQEDILQALVRSQWLSTLDALTGFTQLEIDPKEQEKLAFQLIEAYGSLSKCLSDTKTVRQYFSGSCRMCLLHFCGFLPWYILMTL